MSRLAAFALAALLPSLASASPEFWRNEWPNTDFETVFVFTICWGATPTLEFEVQKEELGPISDAWPLV